ncbi:diguanylate cyclase [Paludibacterium sp. dN 18-1]|uniref:Diguanylate cyclase n=1 Tax=Paludibacterium denitrificans TaxID=2675226 RepID=A0A844G9X8_9NEIS|nr:diguanylate cyclase [Paludibacterium denitrificans]
MLTHAKPERENDGSTLWNGYTTDITERKQGEEQLKQLATSDALTGLNNRRNFYELANAELARVKRYGGPPGALVMLDLDHFKRVNDDYGHAMGDHVLHHVSHLIRDELRIGDIARWRGICHLAGAGVAQWCAAICRTPARPAGQQPDRHRSRPHHHDLQLWRHRATNRRCADRRRAGPRRPGAVSGQGARAQPGGKPAERASSASLSGTAARPV